MKLAPFTMPLGQGGEGTSYPPCEYVAPSVPAAPPTAHQVAVLFLSLGGPHETNKSRGQVTRNLEFYKS